MAINPMSQTTASVAPPQPDLKTENRPQPAGNPATENTPPVARDTVTISKAAAKLIANPNTPRPEATEAAPEIGKASMSGADQVAKLLVEQANALETQKSTTGNAQEPQETSRINRMI